MYDRIDADWSPALARRATDRVTYRDNSSPMPSYEAVSQCQRSPTQIFSTTSRLGIASPVGDWNDKALLIYEAVPIVRLSRENLVRIITKSLIGHRA